MFKLQDFRQGDVVRVESWCWPRYKAKVLSIGGKFVSLELLEQPLRWPGANFYKGKFRVTPQMITEILEVADGEREIGA
jgi:hypothetical protein